MVGVAVETGTEVEVAPVGTVVVETGAEVEGVVETGIEVDEVSAGEGAEVTGAEVIGDATGADVVIITGDNVTGAVMRTGAGAGVAGASVSFCPFTPAMAATSSKSENRNFILSQ